MDNPELLQRLIGEQRRTNQLLAMAELRARREEQDAARVRIANLENVEPHQVILGDFTYAVMRRPEGK